MAQHIDKDISKWSHNDLSHWICNSIPHMNDFMQQWSSHLIDSTKLNIPLGPLTAIKIKLEELRGFGVPVSLPAPIPSNGIMMSATPTKLSSPIFSSSISLPPLSNHQSSLQTPMMSPVSSKISPSISPARNDFLSSSEAHPNIVNGMTVEQHHTETEQDTDTEPQNITITSKSRHSSVKNNGKPLHNNKTSTKSQKPSSIVKKLSAGSELLNDIDKGVARHNINVVIPAIPIQKINTRREA